MLRVAICVILQLTSLIYANDKIPIIQFNKDDEFFELLPNELQLYILPELMQEKKILNQEIKLKEQVNKIAFSPNDEKCAISGDNSIITCYPNCDYPPINIQDTVFDCGWNSSNILFSTNNSGFVTTYHGNGKSKDFWQIGEDKVRYRNTKNISIYGFNRHINLKTRLKLFSAYELPSIVTTVDAFGENDIYSAACGCENGYIQIWGDYKGALNCKDAIKKIVFSPKGNYLAIKILQTKGSEIKIVDLKTYTQFNTQQIKSKKEIADFSWDKNNDLLYCTKNKIIQANPGGQIIAKLENYNNQINFSALSAQNKKDLIAVGCNEGTILFLSIKDKLLPLLEQLITLNGLDSLQSFLAYRQIAEQQDQFYLSGKQATRFVSNSWHLIKLFYRVYKLKNATDKTKDMRKLIARKPKNKSSNLIKKITPLFIKK